MNMESHIKIVAVCHIILGVLGIMFSLLFLVLMGGATLIVGMANGMNDSALPMSVIAIVGLIFSGYIFLSSIPGVIAGIGLLKYAGWARILTIIISILYIPVHFPFGTLLGIYSLWVLFSSESSILFERARRGEPVSANEKAVE